MNYSLFVWSQLELLDGSGSSTNFFAAHLKLQAEKSFDTKPSKYSCLQMSQTPCYKHKQQNMQKLQDVMVNFKTRNYRCTVSQQPHPPNYFKKCQRQKTPISPHQIWQIKNDDISSLESSTRINLQLLDLQYVCKYRFRKYYK